jgi:intracellular septation protein
MKKLLFDLFPIIVFFAAFQLGKTDPASSQALLSGMGIVLANGQQPGVFIATLAAIAATFAQIGWLKLRGQRIDTMLWVSLALIVVFGGATLWLHDENFIKWKPTVLYWLFAGVLALSPWLAKRNLIRLMMQGQIELPDFAWIRLNHLWVGFFAVMGIANLWVAFNFNTDTWVNFKMFGTLGLMLVFVLGQGLYIARFTTEQNRES